MDKKLRLAKLIKPVVVKTGIIVTLNIFVMFLMNKPCVRYAALKGSLSGTQQLRTNPTYRKHISVRLFYNMEFIFCLHSYSSFVHWNIGHNFNFGLQF